MSVLAMTLNLTVWLKLTVDQFTYHISIASKNENHDEIENKFVKELNELKSNKSNIFYSKALDKNVYVYFELITCLGDQPERRGNNYMLGGGGNFGAIYN